MYAHITTTSAAFCLVALIGTGHLHAQGIWTTDTSTGFRGDADFSALAINGKIYVVGYDSLQIFDPSTHRWQTPWEANSYIPSSGCTSSVVGNEIYEMGGNTYDSLYEILHAFDPSSGTWSVPSTSGHFIPREDLTSCVMNGKIYTIGGAVISSINEDSLFDSIQVFDPSSNAWSTPVTTGKFTARSGLTSSVVGGKIYVIGGDTAVGTPCNFLEVFDPSTNSWSTPATTGAFTSRGYLTSSVVNDMIYVIGGDLGGMIRPCNIMEIFDPATNKWTEGPTMPTARFQLSSSVVDGKIYVLGGYRPHETLNTVEVFAPGPLGVNNKSFPSNSISIVNYPDPITSTTTISFTLPEASTVTITLTDAAGRETPLMPTQYLTAGQHEVTWDASNYPSGVYLCRLEAGGQSAARRMVVMH